ncbi:UDP-glucose/GDP-mannose dehydrogenase, partial [Colletotrichum higginsianum]
MSECRVAPSVSLDEAEEGGDLHAPSTVPTSPEGSFIFSPVVGAAATTSVVDGGDCTSDDALEDLLPDNEGRVFSTADARESPVKNICCVGAGYVGGPTAAVIAFHNPRIRVTVVDRDERRIRRWNSKHPPIYEPGLRDIIRCGGEEGIAVPARRPNLFFSTAVSECISDADVVLVAVNTPTKTRGHGAGTATDMAAFEAVTAEVARHARPGAIIVEKST